MLHLTQTWAYQNTPATVPFYIRVRNRAYPGQDMTQVTHVIADVYLPGAAGVAVQWTYLPVTSETTSDTFVGVRTPLPADTAKLGTATIVATPWIGATALQPATPAVLTIRQLAPH